MDTTINWRDNHPWSRDGSREAKAVGADQWFGERAVLFPAASEVAQYCESILKGYVPQTKLTKTDINHFLTSSTWQWFHDSHQSDGMDALEKVPIANVNKFYSRLYTPLDVILVWRDNPHLADLLFSHDPYQFIIDDGDSLEIRVESTFRDVLIERVNGLDISEMMVIEPSPSLVSFLINADDDNDLKNLIAALSHAGMHFSDYAEAMQKFSSLPDVAVESVVHNLFDEVMDAATAVEKPRIEDFDTYIPPVNSDLLTVDGFAMWIYRSYYTQQGLDMTGCEDIGIDTLIRFAQAGVCNITLIKRCLVEGIDAEIAQAMQQPA